MLFAPFIVLSQIVGGAIMSYLRVKFNFWLGFLYHALWNFVFVIFAPLITNLTIKENHVKGNNYEVIIKESSEFSFEEKTLSYSSDLDSVFQLEVKNYPLKDVLFILDSTNSKYKSLVKNIDIELKSEKGILNDTLLFILIKEEYIEKKTQAN